VKSTGARSLRMWWKSLLLATLNNIGINSEQ
jgi:hypothetical protein